MITLQRRNPQHLGNTLREAAMVLAKEDVYLSWQQDAHGGLPGTLILRLDGGPEWEKTIVAAISIEALSKARNEDFIAAQLETALEKLKATL